MDLREQQNYAKEYEKRYGEPYEPDYVEKEKHPFTTYEIFITALAIIFIVKFTSWGIANIGVPNPIMYIVIPFFYPAAMATISLVSWIIHRKSKVDRNNGKKLITFIASYILGLTIVSLVDDFESTVADIKFFAGFIIIGLILFIVIFLADKGHACPHCSSKSTHLVQDKYLQKHGKHYHCDDCDKYFF